jgi:translation elongation factor EF-1beta
MMHLGLGHNSMLKNLSNVFFGAQPAEVGQRQGTGQDGDNDAGKTFAEYLALAVAASTSGENTRRAVLTDPLEFIPEDAEIELATMEESDEHVDAQRDDRRQPVAVTDEKREIGPIEIPGRHDVEERAPSFWRHSFALSVVEQEQEPFADATPGQDNKQDRVTSRAKSIFSSTMLTSIVDSALHGESSLKGSFEILPDIPETEKAAEQKVTGQKAETPSLHRADKDKEPSDAAMLQTDQEAIGHGVEKLSLRYAVADKESVAAAILQTDQETIGHGAETPSLRDAVADKKPAAAVILQTDQKAIEQGTETPSLRYAVADKESVAATILQTDQKAIGYGIDNLSLRYAIGDEQSAEAMTLQTDRKATGYETEMPSFQLEVEDRESVDTATTQAGRKAGGHETEKPSLQHTAGNKEFVDVTKPQTESSFQPTVEVKTDAVFAQNEPWPAGVAALLAAQQPKETDLASRLRDSGFQEFFSAGSSGNPDASISTVTNGVARPRNEARQVVSTSSHEAREADFFAPPLKSFFPSAVIPERKGAAQIENQFPVSPAIEPVAAGLNHKEIQIAEARPRLLVRTEQDRPVSSPGLGEKIGVTPNLAVTANVLAGDAMRTAEIKRASAHPTAPAYVFDLKNGEEARRLDEENSIEEPLGKFTATASNINASMDAPARLSRMAQTEDSWTMASVLPSSFNQTSTSLLSDAASAHRESDFRGVLQGQVEKAASVATPVVHAKDLAGWVVNRASMISNDGRMEVELRLEPESLGAVRIKMDIVAGAMTTRMEVQNVQAKELVESRLPLLQHRLLEHGIYTDKIEVAMAPAPPRTDLSSASAFDTKQGWLQSSPQGQRQPAPHRQHADRQARNNDRKSFLDLMG